MQINVCPRRAEEQERSKQVTGLGILQDTAVSVRPLEE